MTITEFRVPLAGADAGAERAVFIQALIDLAEFYKTHKDVPLPGDTSGLVPLNIRVPGGDRDARAAYLTALAGLLGTEVTKAHGTLWAGRCFGPLLLEGHMRDEDYIGELLRRADARKAAAEATGSAA